MRFEDSKYFKEFKHKKIKFPFGNFYLCNLFIIAELNPGVHFDWDKVAILSNELLAYYGPNFKIGYISNRIHSYSSEPQSWAKIESIYSDYIIASAIVYYSEIGYMNATLEKHISKKSIKRCINLDEAIHWMKNLKELN